MWAQKTQDEDKQTTIQKTRKIRNTHPTKKHVINKKLPTFSIFQLHSSKKEIFTYTCGLFFYVIQDPYVWIKCIVAHFKNYVSLSLKKYRSNQKHWVYCYRVSHKMYDPLNFNILSANHNNFFFFYILDRFY